MRHAGRRGVLATVALIGAATVTHVAIRDVCACDPTPAYYVATTGSDSNPGTQAAPFLSLNKAYTAARPGDVVQIEAGTYTAKQTIAADATKTSADDVVFKPNGAVHFTGTAGADYSVEVNNASHITFDGGPSRNLRIDWFHADGATMSDFTMRRTHVHLFVSDGDAIDWRLVDNEFGANDSTIAGATDCAVCAVGHDDDVMRFGTSTNEDVSNVVIEGNHFHDALHGDPTDHSDCLQFTEAANVTIRRNRFENCYDQSVLLKSDTGAITGIKFENNFVERQTIGSSNYALSMSDGGTGGTCVGCVVSYNTFAGGAFPRLIVTATSGVATGNIISINDATQCSASGTAGWTWTYNAFVSGASGVCGTNTITGSVGLADEAGLDYRLTAGSIAIDAGGAASVPATDIDGTPRPQGAAADIGAHERP